MDPGCTPRTNHFKQIQEAQPSFSKKGGKKTQNTKVRGTKLNKLTITQARYQSSLLQASPKEKKLFLLDLGLKKEVRAEANEV